MNVLDLFSGIGGFSLGLESVGMRTVAFCEQGGYARRILRKHWPEAWLYEDVRTLTAKRLRQDGVGTIDLICGGFPCQDISTAGKGAGIEGARSGLWSEYARLIRELRPRWVLAENVPALRGRGADRVLGDLEAAGYAAWPLVVGAVHAGAPHQRQRAWIVAYAKSQRHDDVPCRRDTEPGDGCKALSDTDCDRFDRSRMQAPREISNTDTRPCRGWQAEPAICRVSDGVSHRMDRLRCLGNSVVPQVVSMLGAAILEADSLLSQSATA